MEYLIIIVFASSLFEEFHVKVAWVRLKINQWISIYMMDLGNVLNTPLCPTEILVPSFLLVLQPYY